MKNKLNWKDAALRFLPLIVMIAILAFFLLPDKLAEKAAMEFGAPLFSHALPVGAKLIEHDAAKDEDGGTTAALLLRTDLSPEELQTFYGDASYLPAEEGQTVELSVKALDQGSLDALKQAKLYEEGAAYCFVYLYSK